MSFQTISKHGTDIATSVRRQFGDESGVQVTDADLLRWINDAQYDIVKRNRLLKTTAVADLVASQEQYTLPNDALYIQQMLVNSIPIEYRSFEEASEYILSSDPNKLNTGQPVMWYEWAGLYYLYPKPSASLTGGIKIHYIEVPTVLIALTDSLSIPDVYFTTLLKYCMSQAHEMDEDWTAANVKGQQYEAAILEDNQENNNANQGTYQRITILSEDM